MIYPLCSLKPGQRGKVCFLRLDGAMRRRLFDIGLIEGTEIECVLKAMSGEPAAYCIRGSTIALRFDVTSQIYVKLTVKE
mgnify:CR=1 FL=1